VTYDGKPVAGSDGPNRENELGYRDDKESHEQEAENGNRIADKTLGKEEIDRRIPP